eukprot:680359-Rhodomonas_salina.3
MLDLLENWDRRLGQKAGDAVAGGHGASQLAGAVVGQHVLRSNNATGVRKPHPQVLESGRTPQGLASRRFVLLAKTFAPAAVFVRRKRQQPGAYIALQVEAIACMSVRNCMSASAGTFILLASVAIPDPYRRPCRQPPE